MLSFANNKSINRFIGNFLRACQPGEDPLGVWGAEVTQKAFTKVLERAAKKIKKATSAAVAEQTDGPIVKRPQNPFLIFSNKHRATTASELRAASTGSSITTGQVSKELGRRWGILTQDERAQYKRLADEKAAAAAAVVQANPPAPSAPSSVLTESSGSAKRNTGPKRDINGPKRDNKGPPKRDNKGPPKRDNKGPPKRDINAYLFFCLEYGAEARARKTGDQTVGQVMGQLWRCLKASQEPSDMAQIQRFRESAAADKQRFEREKIVFNAGLALQTLGG